MPQSWPLSRQQILDASGRPLLVPSVRFFAAGTTEPLTTYSDPEMTQEHPSPVPADGFGRFPRIYLPDGLYKEQVLGPYGNEIWADDGLGIVVPTDPTEPGGDVADPTAVAQTGDTKWRPDKATLPGWVKMNGLTIGAEGSGATQLASSLTQSLYVHLWNNFTQNHAAVSGGRGATALADFSANKPIGVPTMQGLVPAGYDDMGGIAAQRLQVFKTASITSGSTTIALSSNSRVARGMFISGAGIPVGASISDVNGTSATLSAAATATATGVAVSISAFRFIAESGAIGGTHTVELTNRNLPADLPDAKVSVDYPSHAYVAPDKLINLSFGDAGGVTTAAGIVQGVRSASTAAPGSKSFTASQPNAGGGLSVQTQQPTRLGTFYMKL